MAVVVEKGTIRNAIRGIEDVETHICLFEPIDDRQHSNSNKVFIDLNIHESTILIGFENEATEEQISNMVRWHTCQEIHVGDGMATASVGLKFWEYLARGEQYHGSYRVDDEGNTKYIESRSNSGAIFTAARNPAISETTFSEIINKHTIYAQVMDEIYPSIDSIYKNLDSKYPFAPKTIIQCRKIENKKLLDSLQDSYCINTLRSELMNKYFHEIKHEGFELYLKFPTTRTFELLKADNRADTIGLTVGENRYKINIVQVDKEFRTIQTATNEQQITFSKGEYLLQIGSKFFVNRKNGNSTIRHLVPLEESEKQNLLHLFNFHQYTIPENLVDAIQDNNMVGKSMEAYSGVYLQIGGKLNNSKPMPSTITTRNLYKSKLYRGILEVTAENANYTKNKLQLNGLKAKFNLSDMSDLEYNIKQAAVLYKKWANCNLADKEINPEKYACVKTTNDKTKEKGGKQQHLYLIAAGKDFYKLGIHNTTNSKRIFDYIKDDTISQNKIDFPTEEIYETPYLTYHTLKPILNACSVEQLVKEQLLDLDNVITYDNKKGEGIREYFHCEDPATLNGIIQYINKEVSYSTRL